MDTFYFLITRPAHVRAQAFDRIARSLSEEGFVLPPQPADVADLVRDLLKGHFQ